MPAWVLKLGALVTTLLVLGGSYGYAMTHVKNVAAPLQPPVAAETPRGASPSPLPSLVGTRRGNPPRATSSPSVLNLLPGVQATSLPQVTFTHVS
jgi:hypothetical protein